jgi:anti-sigma B factor antagonist
MVRAAGGMLGGMAEATHVSTLVEGGALVARVTTPTVSEYEAGVIERQVLDDAPGGGWRVVVDLSEVMHLSSAGLGMLVTLNKRAKEQNGRLVIASVATPIQDLLRLTKLSRLFTIVDDVEKAKMKVG